MRTKILDLEAFRELIDKKDVEETPTHFRMLHNLGGGGVLRAALAQSRSHGRTE